MPKVIDGIAVQNDGGLRHKRKQEKARRKRLIAKVAAEAEERKLAGLVAQRVVAESREEALANLKQSADTGNLIKNGRRRRRPSVKSRQAYPAMFSPKLKTREFLKEQCDARPDYNGRYAVMGGMSLQVPPGTFISAFTTRFEADMACMLAYKKGDFIKINVIDRGPGFNFQTIHKQVKAV